MSQTPPELNPELLDDFFAEADEHLSALRDALWNLEAYRGKGAGDSEAIEALFRHFHSFKGICGLIGLQPAEALAHKGEDILHAFRDNRSGFSASSLEVLTRAVQLMERVVNAFRDRKPLPDHQSLIAELGAVAGEAGDNPAAERIDEGKTERKSQDSVQPDTQTEGAALWRCTFVPSHELDARGVNLKSVRARLSKCGEILEAAPEVRGAGAIAFKFLVAMRETPTDLAGWESDGIKVELEKPTAHAVESSQAAAAPTEANPFLGASHFVRVDLARLDELMRLAGEMVIQRSAFEQHLQDVSRKKAKVDLSVLQELNNAFARSLRGLREAVMRVRLVPVAEIFTRMPFIVRDLSRDLKKSVTLRLEGQHTEIDKYIIERLKEPLLHLVRNAIAHGIEPREERIAHGKPPEATILLKASAVGDSVMVEVRDDGRGISVENVTKKATERGMKIPAVLNEAALLEIISSPGFSTREDVDEAAGRGVGMAVVNSTIRDLGGSLSMQTIEGEGTHFILRLPLTVALADAFIVSSGEQICAVPQNFVAEVVQVEEADLHLLNQVEVIPYRTAILPIRRMASLFKLADGKKRGVALVLRSERGSVGLLVDKVHGQKEVVVRALRDPLIQVPGVAGATELGNGKPVLILDGLELTSGVVMPASDRGTANDENWSAAK